VYGACNQATAIRFVDEIVRRLPFLVHVKQTDYGPEFVAAAILRWREQAQIETALIDPQAVAECDRRIVQRQNFATSISR
jgi:hypothetical protein